VWDLVEGSVLHESAVLGPRPPTALGVDAAYGRLAVGDGGGGVRLFDLSDLSACRATQVR
jgi:hypothetical protein